MSARWHAANRHPEVPDADFRRFLRYPPGRPLEGALAENAAWARTWFAAHARPWIMMAPAEVAAGWIGARFPGAAELVLVAASAGPEVDAEAAARWQAGEPDRYYFLECYAAAVVEALVAEARARCGAARHLCPGYPGWPITDNAALLAALGTGGALPGPLTVLPSGMLAPKKSMLAVCAAESVSAPR